jgi:putative copper export protein
LAGAGAALLLIAQSANSGGSIGEWLGTRVGRVWLGRVATLIAIGVLLDDIAATARGKRFANLVSIWLPLQLLFLTTLTSHSAAIAQPPIVPFVVDFIHLIARQSAAAWRDGVRRPRFVKADADRSPGLRNANFNCRAVRWADPHRSYLSFLHVGS